MLGIYIIIMLLILLAAIFIILNYIEKVAVELDYKQMLINKLVEEKIKNQITDYNRREDDKDCWGR